MVLSALFVAVTPLAGFAVEVGNAGSSIDVTEKIASISCDYNNHPQMKLNMFSPEGILYPVSYTASVEASGSVGWCTTKIEDVAKKLKNASLIDSYDMNKISNNTGSKTVSLSGLQADAGGAAGGTTAPNDGVCTSILPPSWCGTKGTNAQAGIWHLLSLILNIMTAGVGVLATIGLVISGIQWMTARDNESQIVKAKSRIFNIVIGMVVWALMWLVLSWLMPGGIRLSV